MTGLRVYDTTVADDGHLPEMARFDVYPENDNNTFEGGAWTAHPYFHQKKWLLSVLPSVGFSF
jgi:hypothetical protein